MMFTSASCAAQGASDDSDDGGQLLAALSGAIAAPPAQGPKGVDTQGDTSLSSLSATVDYASPSSSEDAKLQLMQARLQAAKLKHHMAKLNQDKADQDAAQLIKDMAVLQQ